MNDASSHPGEARAGTHVLRMLASPLNGRILRAHLDGPKRVRELHERVAWPAHTTLRVATRSLRKVGALSQRRVNRMPRGVATELTSVGKSVLGTTDALERWLASSPEGAIDIDEPAAKGTMRALAEGWSSSVIPELAAEPLTLTQLDARISALSYPAIERRLGRLRSTRQIQALDGLSTGVRGTPYEATDWLRRATGAVLLAGRCECRELSGIGSRIGGGEIRASLLLGLPLVRLDGGLSGEALLATPCDGAGEVSLADQSYSGVRLSVDRGRVACCPADGVKPPSWALGTPDAWLDVLVDGDLDKLRFGGDAPELAEQVTLGLHQTLFETA